MNLVRNTALLAAILASVIALAGYAGVRQAQAEERTEKLERRAEKAEERAEKLAEEAEELAEIAEEGDEKAEERAEKAEEKAEKAEEKAEELAEKAEESAESTNKGRAEKTGAERRGSQDATLRIEGGPKAEFSGTCTVGDEEHALSSRVPQSFDYDLEGRKLECEIRNEGDGSLKVLLTAGGTRAVQQTNAGTTNLVYKDGSVSSSTSSGSAS